MKNQTEKKEDEREKKASSMQMNSVWIGCLWQLLSRMCTIDFCSCKCSPAVYNYLSFGKRAESQAHFLHELRFFFMNIHHIHICREKH